MLSGYRLEHLERHVGPQLFGLIEKVSITRRRATHGFTVFDYQIGVAREPCRSAQGLTSGMMVMVFRQADHFSSKAVP